MDIINAVMMYCEEVYLPTWLHGPREHLGELLVTVRRRCSLLARCCGSRMRIVDVTAQWRRNYGCTPATPCGPPQDIGTFYVCAEDGYVRPVASSSNPGGWCFS